MRCAALVCVGALTVASAALARTETAPQQFKPGAVVKLRAVDVELKLPPSDDAWTVSLAVEGADAWDILRRGELTFELSRPRVADCSVIASTLDAQKAKKRASSPLAPMSFEAWSYEIAGGAHRLCTNTYNGPVVADVSSVSSNAAEVSSFLTEVARMVAGRRGTAGLTAKAPTVSIVGKTMLAASGVQADIPKGFTVRVETTPDGAKVDVIERVEPREPFLAVRVERRVASCATSLPQGTSVLDAPYLPDGFGPASIETRAKDVRTATFCMELASDAVIASVSYAGELTHADVRSVQSILAPIAAGRSGVGTTFASDRDADEREDPMEIGARIRGAATLDALLFTARDESNRPFAAGLSFDAYSSTARHGLGFAVEVGARGAVGSNKFLAWDVFGGVGAALTFGRFFAMLTVGGGADAFHGVRYKDSNETLFEAVAAGYLHLSPRVIIPLGRKVALDLRSAYVHRFEETVGHELRGHLGVAISSVWLGVRATRFADRALLAGVAVGFAF